MSGLSVAILGGVLIGLGVTLALMWLAPATPDPKAALQRLNPDSVVPTAQGRGLRQRVGLAAANSAPAWSLQASDADLALLGIDRADHFARKLLLALLGLLLPGALLGLLAAVGIGLPAGLAIIGGPVLAALLWFGADWEVSQQAAAARREFTAAAAVFLDLAALDKSTGSGVTQAIHRASEPFDSWPFAMIRGELRRAEIEHVAVWDALRRLGNRIAVPELVNVADLAQVAGEQGANMFDALRGAAGSIRDEALNQELAEANAAGETLAVPQVLLAVLFMLLLVIPAIFTFAELG